MSTLLHFAGGLCLAICAYLAGGVLCLRWVAWLDRRRLRRAWRELNARSLSTLTARPPQPDRRH